MEDPIIARSALKHGLGEEEILHAYRNPIRSWDLGDGFIMLIGANAAAIILEVGYVPWCNGGRHRPRDAGQGEVPEVICDATQR